MDVSFRSSEVGPNAGIFGQFRTTYTLSFGLLKQPWLMVGLKLSMCVVWKILLRVMTWSVYGNKLLMHIIKCMNMMLNYIKM